MRIFAGVRQQLGGDKSDVKRVTLTSSTSQLLGSKKVVHFVIVADLNQTGGAS